MKALGLWQISGKGPQRLEAAELAVERDLEGWIEGDPSLLEKGLVIVGRQIRLEGGPLDLLALDPSGRLVLIEVKKERLRREVITQAIDYASCLRVADAAWLHDRCDEYMRSKGRKDTLATLLEERSAVLNAGTEGREILIYLVGTSIDPDLTRMVGYLTDAGDISVNLITFSVFRDSNGTSLLAREIHEGADARPTAPRDTAGRAPTAEELIAVGDEHGVGHVMRALQKGALELGLYVRPWYKSVMFAPMASKKKCLFTVWNERLAKSPGAAKVYVATEAIGEYLGVPEATVVSAAGGTGWVTMTEDRAKQFVAALKTHRESGAES